MKLIEEKNKGLIINKLILFIVLTGLFGINTLSAQTTVERIAENDGNSSGYPTASQAAFSNLNTTGSSYLYYFDLPVTEEVSAASLTFTNYYAATVNSIEIFGLDTVTLASNKFDIKAEIEESLQNDFISDAAQNSTNTSVDISTFINKMVNDNGAGPGKYIVFRVKRNEKDANWYAYNSNGDNPDEKKPTLTLTYPEGVVIPGYGSGVEDTLFLKNRLIPDIDDEPTRAHNFTIINELIDSVGILGGGIIKIPEGTFYIGPNLTEGEVTYKNADLGSVEEYINIPDNPKQAILIQWDNITLCGSGMDKTVLKTNGTFVPTAWPSSYSLNKTMPGGRGNGIWIYGTNDVNNPRKNIVIKDFELDGQAGHSGNYSLDYFFGSDNGWDMWHKGIITTGEGGFEYIDSITIENVRFHHYRGEILYGGGEKLGRLHIKNIESYGTNASTCNLHASEMIIEDSKFGKESDDSSEDCRFWVEITGRHYKSVNQTHKALFRNNVFRGGNTSGMIAICQGDYSTYELEFDNNNLDANSNDLFSIMGGIAGPVKIHDNVINNCGWAINGNILGGGVAPGAEKRNSNVYFENNTVTEGRCLAYFSGPADQFYIRNNVFTGKSATLSQSIMWVAGDNKVNFYYDNIVEGNTFSNCLYPQKRNGWGNIDFDTSTPAERPLMKNNIYNSPMTKKEGFTIYNITSSSNEVEPNYEEVEIYADADAVVAAFDVFAYSDGQVIKVFGGAAGKRVKFATGQTSYIVNEDKYLAGATDTIEFRYIKAAKVWMEKSSDTYSVTGVSIENGTEVNIFKDATLQLKALIYPAYAFNTNVSWESSDEGVVTVDEFGLVTGISQGTANITVITEDGNKQASIAVTVVEPIRWLGRYSKGFTLKFSSCGEDNGSIIIDESFIEGGSGNYAYSLRASKGMAGWDVIVDDPLWGSNNIQASPEFLNLAGLYRESSGPAYALTIYDMDDSSLTCNEDSTGARIGVVVFGTRALEMLVNTDDVSLDDDVVSGKVSIQLSGGAGGIDNLYGTDKIGDGLSYNVTILDVAGDTITHTLTLHDDSTTYTFDAPAANFVIDVADAYGACSVTETVAITGVGVNDIFKTNVSLYPNPTDGNVIVAFGHLPAENTVIRVFNYTGLLITEKAVYSQREEVNLSGQAAGIYFVNITGGNTSKTLKLILK